MTNAGMWRSEKYEDPVALIDMPEIGASISLAEMYDTLKPRRQPRLQLIGSADASELR